MIAASARGPPVDDAIATACVARERSPATGAPSTGDGARQHAQPGRIRLRRRAQRVEQPVVITREIEADRARRLEHEVDRAQLERAERRFVPVLVVPALSITTGRGVSLMM